MRRAGVDVWLLETEPADPAYQVLSHSWLSDDERDRADRFHFERDRVGFVLARGLTRAALGHAAGCSPAELVFGANRYGRLHVAAPRPARHLSFSPSRARGLVGVALGTAGIVGFDLEWAGRPVEPLELGPTIFSDPELGALRTLEPACRRDRFFHLWVLKESYIKARGMGLSLDLKSFAFDLDSGRIGFTPPAGDHEPWQFHLEAVPLDHFMAVCSTIPPAGLRSRDGRELLA